MKLEGFIDIIPGVGSTKTRNRLDEVFSRQMLGSILVGAAVGKIIEKFLNIFFMTTVDLLVGWSIAFVLFTFLFVYWERIETITEQ